MYRILTAVSGGFIIMGASFASFAVSEGENLVKMARSGVDEEVLESYIESSPDTFNLSAEEIIALKDLGVSSKVISEALRHGGEIDSAAARKMLQEASLDVSETAPAVSSAAAVAPPAENLNMSFFYESLYPYGNWLMIDGDWCWQPNATVINERWAPYWDQGRWVHSDWGWCWVSNYSWGWAPFHYGRWLRHQRHGWCWVPDTNWGPAWVAWRSGNGYCGWGPLPPRSRYIHGRGFFFGASLVGDDFEFNLTFHDYHFLPIGYLDDSHPLRHMVPQSRTEEIYGKTTFVRNGYGFDHGHIINQGLPREEISKVSGRNVRSLTIMEENLRPGQPIRQGVERENRLFIYKPMISSAVPETPAIMQTRFAKTRTSIQGDETTARREMRRRETAQRTAIKNERLIAETARQKREDLEKAARDENDAKKRAELQVEAGERATQALRANAHANRIEQEQKTETPIPMPRTRIVPEPSSDNKDRIRRQIQSNVFDEARFERQTEEDGRRENEKPMMDTLPRHRTSRGESNLESGVEKKKPEPWKRK